MQESAANAPAPAVSTSLPNRYRPRDYCKACRKGHNFCVNGLASSGVATGVLMFVLFLISVAILSFTGEVGRYFLPVANAWRNALAGMSLGLSILTMFSLKARFQNFLFFASSLLTAMAWAFAVIATFDGNQVYQIYRQCQELQSQIKAAQPNYNFSGWTCPLWDGAKITQLDSLVTGGVILSLVATATWLFASSVVNRRANVIAQEVEEEQKLFDALGHVGALTAVVPHSK